MAVVFFSVLYGVYAEQQNLFPASTWRTAKKTWKLLFEDTLWFQHETEHTESVPRMVQGYSDNRLNKIVAFDKGDSLAVTVKDSEGKLVHKWSIDWFDLWDGAPHVPHKQLPKTRPGTMIHGAHIFPNGDLVFNFENLGMIRLDTSASSI